MAVRVLLIIQPLSSGTKGGFKAWVSLVLIDPDGDLDPDLLA